MIFFLCPYFLYIVFVLYLLSITMQLSFSGGLIVTDKEFNALKQKALSKYFSKLNNMQQEAVFTVNGPVLILAGAGSGKTTVLVNRVANMIYFGNAYYDTVRYAGVSRSDEQFLEDYANGITTDSERLKSIVAVDCVNPWNILAITFTNKAAGELKERLAAMLGEQAQGITAATFHSACVRILRREIEKLGYDKSFTIYDTDDSVRVIKSCLQDLNMSDKMYPPKSVLGEISHAKEAMMTPDEYSASASGDYRKQQYSKLYSAYQQKLINANALDFDDIILLTVRLFEENPDVLDHYQNLYKYILVDEYQDTNMVQYRLVSMLSQKRKNLCVVGDDDQSIYKFRGATIENILSFEEQYQSAKVIRLEQNYRSTQNILTCANEVIKNNKGRKGKNLWTSAGEGSLVTLYKASTEQGEARFVANMIFDAVKKGGKYSDNAVLYRMNAQSNAIERALVASGITYRVIGGVKFYDRKEIKDIIAYLSVINNETDMLRLKRIINEPKRGIGDATVDMLEQISSDLGEPPLNIMRSAKEIPALSRAAARLCDVAAMFDDFKLKAEIMPLAYLLDEIMDKTGYLNMLRGQGEEGATRLENIEELKSTMVNYSMNAEEPTLSGFLEEIALYTDIDSMNPDDDAVTLMTVHAAKGLEFDNVFVVGLEENIFPSSRSVDLEEDLEEERRLAYVAITRAKKNLYLSCASQRMLFGSTSFNRPSRFVDELPKDYVELKFEHKPTETNRQRPQSAPAPIKNGFGTAGFGGSSARNSAPAAPKAPAQDFNVGDRVKHNVFGEGTVVRSIKMSSDTMLEVAFEKVGTKKIMAAFAKIQKL